MSFPHVQTNSKDAQIAAVRPVDQATQAILDDFGSGGDQFKEQEYNRESQPMQLEYRTQVGAFQIKAVLFEVAEHFFDPHPSLVRFQSFAERRQVGGQQPGFLFADFPVGQDIDRIGVQLGQLSLSQPQALTRLSQKASQSNPEQLIIFSNQMAAFLAQNVLPVPLIQLS